MRIKSCWRKGLFVLALLLSMNVLAKQDAPYFHTGLPVCLITVDIPTGGIPRFEYIPATICVVEDADTLLRPVSVSIAGRGNATWGYPKKPYRLKFGSKVALLGMPEGKNFALLANYCDKSLMRTSIGLAVGRTLQQPWVPEDRFVELVINGEHVGTYQLAESIKVGKNRVELGDTGFLIEYDTNFTQQSWYFRTETYAYPMAFKHPDESMTEEVYDYACQYMNAFEEALDAPDFLKTRKYADYIDVESYAKWYYQKNLLQMEECNRYYLKADTTQESRLCMGPLWDFEWCLGVGHYYGEVRPNPNHYMENKLYFARIADDPLFMKEVAKLHLQYRDLVRDNVLAMYDKLKEELAQSQALNFERWNILDKQVSIGAIPLGSWEAEVECDRQFFLAHLAFLDTQLQPYIPTDITSPKENTMKEEPQNAYTLLGQPIDPRQLKKGIYIINGKKVTIR
ncbi:MAG: CotH kinase family protein [Bacteroidaceae bacterium]|nr:CotH kinase family protein [Bacteroidaceae bacterium]